MPSSRRMEVRCSMEERSFVYGLLCCYFLIHCFARDSITRNGSVRDSRVGTDTLVSKGYKFELGFFAANVSSGVRRYVGVWYYMSNPLTVVWVANRDAPLSDYDGVVSLEDDGNLKVLDGKGRVYWSTHLETNSSVDRKVKLMDSGNLVMSRGDLVGGIVWQSFDNPTDTFLPGMKMDENLALVSWRSYDDPAYGNFTFQLDQEADQFVIWKRSVRYWKSGGSDEVGSSTEMPSSVSYFLSNFTSTVPNNDSVPYITSSLYIDTRLVMSFSGQIQYLKWDSQKVWTLFWAMPRTRCSVFNACGNFGSCNGNNELVCKCLPGFQPTSPEYWNSGDYSGGCTRKSPLCNGNEENDPFLNLKMMKVGNPDSQFKAKSEMECKAECLNNCQCQAFSYQEAENEQLGEPARATCWIWLEDLTDLQEEYDSGRNLNVRISVSDIDLTSRNCGTCGTDIVPYPLSTGPNCGDPTYFSFYCNTTIWQLSFHALSSTYKVTRINPELHTFVIEINDRDNCKAMSSNGKLRLVNQSSPFHVIRWCNAYLGNYSSDAASVKGGGEAEISWEPPQEPTCSSVTDCRDWPNSTCKAIHDGSKRCLCNKSFRWDGLTLNCTQEGHPEKQRNEHPIGRISSSLITAVAFCSFIVFIVLSGTIIYMYLQRRRWETVQGRRRNLQRRSGIPLYGSERLVKEIIDSGRFKEDDSEAIDVPFFDLESISVATKNFSNSNKLGQGGFGPVYKATFPGGEEIAVKRLSSGSGQGLEEFKNEVILIAKLQHRNLVRLLGYCVEGDEKILLYEYMPNKSLDNFIFDRKLCMLLNWETRYNIIIGIARGLLYLHQDSRLRIIHRDLKTSNILLDEEMNPKISDFGLARIFGGKETVTNTHRVVGTYGYIAPEYALDGLFSFKSDVFSFGIVVLEIVSGRRNTGFFQPEKSLSLISHAWNLCKEEKALELLEPSLGKRCNPSECLKCINIGLLCVQEDPSDRPTMSNVLIMLGSETTTLPSPKQPAFVVRRCPSSGRASTSSKPQTCSNNGLTITLQDGR